MIATSGARNVVSRNAIPVTIDARPIEEFEDLGSFVMFGMVKSIKRGNGWARIELVDETGSIGLFHTEQTQIETGQMYFILVGDNRIARYVKVSEIDPTGSNSFVDYLYKKQYDLDEDFPPYANDQNKELNQIVREKVRLVAQLGLEIEEH